MKKILILSTVLICIIFQNCNTNDPNKANKKVVKKEGLPEVLSKNHSDLVESRLRLEAELKFNELQLPDNINEWEIYKVKLKNGIINKAGVIIDHKLALNIKETATIQMKGYTIKNIAFQTRPGVYATANLYIPDGKGPFPAVINMLGHWRKGKIDTTGPQAVGHTLALNKYVCLTIDPWGAGERTTKHGDFEYHGSNLGASLMNIGETLMGIQISDNMRGVDLLCSLNYVDPEKIGATGASGGGNQTMWLSAVDERIKATVPVVSVGNFESYIMQSNCICELLPDGMTFTEEAGVLALSNAILLINHKQDSNPTFFPAEMLRSFNNAKAVFQMYGKENNISYQLFDLTHGYMREDREAMLGWFDLYLKGIGSGAPKKEIPFKQLPEEKLMVFPVGQRDANIVSTDKYCINRGGELRTGYLNNKSFDIEQKRRELKAILRLDDNEDIRMAHQFSSTGGWERIALETSDNKLIPLLKFAPGNISSGYVIICNTEGKNNISPKIIDDLKKKRLGIVIVDLSGTGEVTSTSSLAFDEIGKLHTLSRADLWLGKTVLGEWVEELNLVAKYLNSTERMPRISIDGSKEAGLAGLFFSALEGNVENVILRDAPLSYLFDSRESVDYFSMGIHLPGFLNWGDISLATAMTGKNVTFINPVTMSGNKLNTSTIKEYQAEYDKVRKICKKKGKTVISLTL
jgi:hypothetical protein